MLYHGNMPWGANDQRTHIRSLTVKGGCPAKITDLTYFSDAPNWKQISTTGITIDPGNTTLETTTMNLSVGSTDIEIDIKTKELSWSNTSSEMNKTTSSVIFPSTVPSNNITLQPRISNLMTSSLNFSITDTTLDSTTPSLSTIQYLIDLNGTSMTPSTKLETIHADTITIANTTLGIGNIMINRSRSTTPETSNITIDSSTTPSADTDQYPIPPIPSEIANTTLYHRTTTHVGTEIPENNTMYNISPNIDSNSSFSTITGKHPHTLTTTSEPVYYGKVQLVGGPTSTEGRVEIEYHGIYGTICDDGFDDTDATIVCKTLGYR